MHTKLFQYIILSSSSSSLQNLREWLSIHEKFGQVLFEYEVWVHVSCECLSSHSRCFMKHKE